jgi:hypothetical protein
MSLPRLNSDGFLPVGIYDCTLAEIRARFGVFQSSDHRPRLFRRLEELAIAMKESQLFVALLIDGSFVSRKPVPNDIDILAILRPSHSFECDLPMSQYALISRSLLRRRFGFDIIVAEEGSSLYKTYVEFFNRVRERPDLKKGLLRLTI